MCFFRKVTLSLLAFGLVMSACTKEEEATVTDEDQQLQSAEDNAAADAVFEDVYDIVDEEAQQHSEVTDGLRSQQHGVEVRNNCAIVTMETNDDPNTVFPVNMTMDFGDGCTTPRGREISGRILINFTDRLRKPGAQRTVTFQDLVVNGYRVSGTKTVTNNGLNTNDKFSYTVRIDNGMVTTPDGRIIEHSSTRTRTWIEGMDTNFRNDGIEGVLDDVWEITGAAEGINRNGVAYTMNVVEGLRREFTCRWLVSGIMEVNTSQIPGAATIDFGDGTCDNKATVTIGQFTKEVILPKAK